MNGFYNVFNVYIGVSGNIYWFGYFDERFVGWS